MNKIKSLSVFFPAVNEEKNIKNTVEKAVDVLDGLGLEYEVIIVDDGSIDDTGKIIDEIAKNNSKIKAIHHAKNLGYGSALKTGFKNAKYPWVAFMDSDGQFDFSEITLLLDKTDVADVILGYRLNRADSFLRKVFTFGWQMLALILLGLNTKDYSCGFKLIKKQVFEKVQPLEGEEKVTQIELLVKAKRLGYKFAEVGVHHFARKFGIPTGAKLSVVVKSVFDLLKLWWEIKDEKLAFFAIVAILILATFLRFYNLSGYMTFLGDEGRDALIIKKLLVTQDVPFIGPPTSVGNIYLGPLYYYMMSVPMAIFWLNPVAAAGMDAVIGILTVALIYYLGKIWFGRVAGLISAFLYAISPVTIIYSRSSWNPNPAPFFALIGIWSIFKAHNDKNSKWYILTGFSLAAALQMHYLSLILLPIFGLLWTEELYRKYKLKVSIKNFYAGTVGGIVAFWVLMLPLVLFDFKHNFLNSRAILAIFTSGSSVGFNIVSFFVKIPTIYTNNLAYRYLSGQNLILSIIISLLILVPVIKLIIDLIKKRPVLWQYLALSLWLIIGIVGLSFYQNNVYDHYLGFLNPAAYLLLGASFVVLQSMIKQNYKKIYYGVWIIFLLILSISNLILNPLRYSPNNGLQRTQGVAKLIIEKANDQPFNFALIAKNNYDSAYQFYLDLYGHKPLVVPANKTKQLFVVCEDADCNPPYSAKYEIAGFGLSKIVDMQEFEGVKIYKLVANPTGAPPK